MSSTARLYRDISLQFDVIGALVLRELHTRYGRNNVGYLWMIGEPLILGSVIGLIHSFQASHLGTEMSPVPLSVIGYCIFIIFRGIFNRSESLMESSIPLLYHRMISPLNVSVSRVISEVAGCFGSMCILLGICMILGLCTWPARPLDLLAGVGLMTWLSFAMGLNCTSITFERPTLGRLVHPFSYFMMPLSGAFLPMSWCPQALIDVQLWNPMALTFEIARYGMFENAPDEYLHPGYICIVCAALTYTGLISLRGIKDRIHLS
jgi:capsular polysaccharide transport system permease protein